MLHISLFNTLSSRITSITNTQKSFSNDMQLWQSKNQYKLFLIFFSKKKEERTYRKQIKLCNLLCKFTIELFQIFSGMLNYAPQGEIAKIHQSKNLSLAKVERNRNYMSKTHQQHNEKAPLRLFEQYRTLDNS